MTSRDWFIAGAAVVVVLAGCSGSHAVPPVTTAASSTTPRSTMSTAKFTLTIPSKANTSPAARRIQYVSASTQSGGITVNGGPTVYGFDLTAGGPNCTNVVSGRTCAISVPAPIGNPDTFALTLYDGVLISGQPSGTALSASVGFTAVVAEGKTNVTTPLVLDGIPASYQLVITQEPAAYATGGAASSGAMVLDVYDADSNLIVGPGNYTTGSNTVTGFSIGTNSANYKLSVNGGAAASSIHTTASTDQLTLTQTNAALGANLTVSPDVVGPIAIGTPAFVRPSGFTANDIEAASFSSGAMGSQLAPISENTDGVAGFANYGAVGQFSTGSGVGAVTSCGTGFVRNADYAEAQNTGWFATGSIVFTYDLPTCTANPQFSGATDVGIGTGIYLVESPLPNGCRIDYMFPGVEEDPGTGAPSNCSYPHDLLNNGHSYFAVIETNTSDTLDHLAVYNGLTFMTDLPVTSGGTLISSAARVDDIFVEQLPAGKLWSVSEPGAAPAAVQGSINLPAGYTYVNNTFSSLGVAYSNRTLAIGSDGLAYIAVSSPYNGVLCFDPSSGSVIAQLPNNANESGVAPFNVVSDIRGTIYWSAGAYVMHYPAGVSAN
jgi:hypothetical protein